MIKRKYLLHIFFVGVAVFLLYWSFQKIDESDWESILYALKHLDYLLVLLSAAIIVASHLCRSERWLLLIKPDTEHPPRSSSAFWSLMVGYLANMLVPRLGEVTRCTLMSKYEQIPTVRLIGTIVVERAVDVLCLFLVFAITAIVEFTTLSSYFDGVNLSVDSLWYKVLIGLLLIVFCYFVLRYLAARFDFIGRLLVELKKGILSIKRVKNKFKFIAYTALMWFLYVASIKIGFMLFEETRHLSWGASLTIISVGSVAMIITQGGIGAYQLMVMEVLILYHIGEAMGFAVGWLFWLLPASIALFLGGLGYFILPFLSSKRNQISVNL